MDRPRSDDRRRHGDCDLAGETASPTALGEVPLSDEPTVDPRALGATRQEQAREPAKTAPRSTQNANAPRFTPTSDAHAHAHAHAPGPRELVAGAAPTAGSFPHEKLDAYWVALDLARLSRTVAEKVPRGDRSIADHLLRAASNTVRLLAEGANRRGAAQKRQRFVESRGECAEVAAAADLLLVLAIGSKTDAEELKKLAGRVSAMLTRLIARLGTP